MPKATKALQFFQVSQERMEYLFERWQDEKRHEDIGDYLEVLEPFATPLGVVLTRMTSRPFGVRYEVDGKKFYATMTATKWTYKQTG